MTEMHWLSCNDPIAMLSFLRSKASERKLRHFSIACCQQVRRKSSGQTIQRMLELNEQVADGVAPKETLLEARLIWLRKLDAAGHPPLRRAVLDAIQPQYTVRPHPAHAAAQHAAAATRHPEETKAAQCSLIRDIFGNPFRRVLPDSNWTTNSIKLLARSIYDDRDFARLPVLADALDEAGCANEDVLAHLRGPGPHVRGCWVVDLLLSKE